MAALLSSQAHFGTYTEVIEHLSAWWYRGQAAADELIESAPMVEVIFSGGE